MDRKMARDLDNYITGHYGEDQLRHPNPDRDKLAKEAIEMLKEATPTNELYPSPAALAAANRLTDEIFSDVYRCACFLDEIAEEARTNERKRIFNMGFWELTVLMWNSKKIYRK